MKILKNYSGMTGTLIFSIGLPVAGITLSNLFFSTSKLVQIPLHSAAEGFGAVTALLLALLLMNQRDSEGGDHYFWISCGLIGMGILDGFHASVSPGSEFVWLHSMAILAGGIFFASTWLAQRSASARSIALPAIVAILAIIVGILFVAFPGRFPQASGKEGFSFFAKAVNILAGALFFLAASFFIKRYRENRQTEDLVFLNLSLLFGFSGVLFPFSYVWMPDWWFWHVLRLGAYFIAFLYSLNLFRQNQIELARVNEGLRVNQDQLETKVVERTAELEGANRDLLGLMRVIKETVSVLTRSVDEIVAASAQVFSGAAETATSVTQTSTTVEEVRQISNMTNEKAKLVQEKAQKTEEISRIGNSSVDGLINGMNSIQDQMRSIAHTVIELSEQNQAVGEIIATVEDIAEQSNILAVNAAIEAAKTVEGAEGFSVVAREIKILSQQSKQAVSQIRTILIDINKAVKTAAMATEKGANIVDDTMKQSSGAGESIELLSKLPYRSNPGSNADRGVKPGAIGRDGPDSPGH